MVLPDFIREAAESGSIKVHWVTCGGGGWGDIVVVGRAVVAGII